MDYQEKSFKRYAYVVEGMMDEDKLKKLGCLFVIKTGGKYIRPEVLRFIKNVSEAVMEVFKLTGFVDILTIE